MKRILILLLALLLTAPALAWEVSDEMNDFAAQVAPGHVLLDGACYGNTAMLILEDEEGVLYFAGCVKNGDGWTVTLSAPLPDVWPALGYTAPGYAVLNLYSEEIFPPRSALGDMDCNYAIRLQEDGRWLIEEVRTGDCMLYFSEGCVESEGRTGGMLYGEMLFSRDIAGVDWLTFPLTLAEAADRMALEEWAVTRQAARLYDAPQGEALAVYHAGVPLRILAQEGDFVRVAILGGGTEGWFRMEELLIGRDQLDAPLTVLPWKTLTTGGDVRELGLWMDGRIHVESDRFPGGDGYMQISDFIPDDGPVG